jgi:hypothetical protein
MTHQPSRVFLRQLFQERVRSYIAEGAKNAGHSAPESGRSRQRKAHSCFAGAQAQCRLSVARTHSLEGVNSALPSILSFLYSIGSISSISNTVKNKEVFPLPIDTDVTVRQAFFSELRLGCEEVGRALRLTFRPSRCLGG